MEKSDSQIDESKGFLRTKIVRINSRGHVRPRLYNVFPDDIPVKRCKIATNNDLDAKVKDDELQEGTAPDEVNRYILDEEIIEEEIQDEEIIEEEIQDEKASKNDNLNNEAAMNVPIYTGHTMTIFTSIILVWVYAMTHSITGSQLSDLLVLLNAHCLNEIPVFSSLQSFKKYFADLKSPIIKNYYCSSCLMNAEDSSQEICLNAACGKDLQKKNGMSYFVELPLQTQLNDLFQRSSFREHLKYRFNRTKRQADGIEDIYDGELYKKQSLNGKPLSDPNNISLTWNTDGVPVFKSSKFSIWPMYLMINELPYKERIKKSNMLFYGLWFGDIKPPINLFCNPLLNHLKTLETDGFEINTVDDVFHVKAFLICGTADLPAKSTALNMIQFNGDSSCNRCLQKGLNLKTGNRGYVHIFPFDHDNPVGPYRVSEDCIADAAEAVNTSGTINGIKGPTFLNGLSSYDFASSTAIDYMHCVLLGVTKKLMTFWFSVGFSSEPFSLVKRLDEIDDRLMKVKPNYRMTRRPRTISNHFKFWKASELRSWLLFYSVPILQDVMSPVYFFHYCTFVESIWILCQESILPSEIEHSYFLLNYFVFMMESLYGARYMTLNTHSLLHLPKCVKDLGPLWVYSCFAFESLNGDLLKLFHGTQAVEMQIVAAINSHQFLPNLLDQLPNHVKENTILKRFVHSSQTVLKQKIDHNIYTVGGKKKVQLSAQQKDAFKIKLGFKPVFLTFYDRIMLRNHLFHSELYTRVQARNSYTVKFLSAESNFCFGHIVFFAVHRFNRCVCTYECKCRNSTFACLKILDKHSESVLDTSHVDYPAYLKVKVGHIHKLKYNGNVQVVDLHNIVSLCVDTSFSDDFFFICESPNICESD